MKYQGLAFKNRKIDFHKLKQYGFRQKDGSYIFNTKLKKGEFELILSISKIDDLDYKIIEIDDNSELGELNRHILKMLKGNLSEKSDRKPKK